MVIERLELFSLVFEFPRRAVAAGWNTGYRYLLVKFTDSDGVAGWGECELMSGLARVVAEAGQVAIGREATDAIALNEDMAGAAQSSWAASGLSIALDDLRARALGVPIYDLYGGRRRDRIRAYGASAGYPEGVGPEIAWPEEMARLVDEGFTALKMRIGRYPLEHEAPLYERIRRDVPAHIDLAADGNAGYTIRTAVPTARILQDLGFLWFEEPLNQWDGYRGYEILHPMLSIALAGGEVTMSRNAARELIDRSALDIYQPDPVIIGGIGELLFNAKLARLNAITTIPHTTQGGIGTAAAIQAIAALPNPTRLPGGDLPLLEFGTAPNPWRTEIFTTPLRLDRGWIDVPTTPGLGFEVDEAFVRAHAAETIAVTA
jgi:D-galactarolactone cycloisomerase